MSTPATKRAHEKPVVIRAVLHKPHEIDRPRVFVNPPIIHIGNGDAPKIIRWDNQTGGPVKFWLADADDYFVCPPGKDFSTPFDVDTDKALELEVKRHPKKGHFPYHIFCQEINGYAEGNSSPNVTCP